MKWVLDEDVDAACRTVLIDAGHEAWLLSQAGRSSATDEDQTVYAHDHGAIFLTHDRNLVNIRSRMPIGRLVRLACVELLAADLLQFALPSLEPILEHNANLIVVVHRDHAGELRLECRFGTEPRR